MSSCLSPPFLVLPPTTKFPHPVVAHGDFGMIAVVLNDGLVLKDDETGRWDGTSAAYDPHTMAEDAIMALSRAAKAPPDRLGAVIWFRNGIGAPDDFTCVSQDPADLGRAVETVMRTRLSGHHEPMAPWIGAYASAASTPKQPLDAKTLRAVKLIDKVVAAATKGDPIICYSIELTPYDLADPAYMLPALATAAFEDWALVVRGKGGGPPEHKAGFRISLTPDPAALLGYRVESITPATPFNMLAPLVAALRRCMVDREYIVDEIVQQFGRYLQKHGLDATVVDEVDMRLLATEGGESDGT